MHALNTLKQGGLNLDEENLSRKKSTKGKSEKKSTTFCKILDASYNLRIMYMFISMKDKENTRKDWSIHIKFCHSCANIVKQVAKKVYKRSILIFLLSLFFLSLTFLAYLGVYTKLSKLVLAAETVTVSSEGPAAEMYPDSMGQYKVLRDVYPHDRYRVVYKHVDREDRFIIYTGNKQYKYL